jgi:hypothetical protein
MQLQLISKHNSQLGQKRFVLAAKTGFAGGHDTRQQL